MNGSLLVIGLIATVSVIIAGFVAYRISTFTEGIDISRRDHSSLDEDLADVLAFVPVNEVQSIVENYLKYDQQIAETVSFVNDQKSFILREFERMPEVKRLVDFLRLNGLNVDRWGRRIRNYWKTMPAFVRSEPDIVSGGLTVMISTILKVIPRDELHELLRQKAKYSRSFCALRRALISQEFIDLCHAIENNVVLHRHYFWARESGIEITFALELLQDLYVYLVEGIG